MRKIAFIGNCQLQAMYFLYDRFVRPRTGDKLDYLPSYQALTDAQRRATAQAEIVVEQVFDFEQKAGSIEVDPAARRVQVPTVTAGFLYPFSGQPHPRNTPSTCPALRDGPYPAQLGDAYLNRMIKSGIDPEAAVEQYLQEDINSRVELDRLFEIVIEKQKQRDRGAGFSLAETIADRFREEALFLTRDHPNLRLSVALASQFFAIIGAEKREIERLESELRLPPFPRSELPIHPSIAAHFQLRFAPPERQYRMFDGFFTFREFALRYMRFEINQELLDGIEIERKGGDPATAAEKLALALAKTPGSAAGQFEHGCALGRQGKVREAIEAVQTAIRLDPGPAPFHAAVARLLARAEEPEKAILAIRQALEREPHNLEFLTFLESVLRRSMQQCRRELNEAAELNYVKERQPEVTLESDSEPSTGTRSSSSRQMVSAVYRALLHREPDPVGAAGYSRHFTVNAPAEAVELVARSLVNSEEFKRKYQTGITARNGLTVESLRYANDHMSGKPRFANRDELLVYSITQIGIPGLVLEFGVASGHTINIIAHHLPDRTIYGFDSFKGLPEPWGWADAGHFARASLPEVRDNVKLVVGLFNDTLAAFIQDCPQQTIALLHVDCDLYSSTKTIFDQLCDRIVPGTVIVFDEYWNYVSWKENEFKAFQEFVERTGTRYEYIGYTLYEQVAVRIL